MVNIPAGIYDGTIGTAIIIPTLAIIDDVLVEVDETIVLNLSAATGGLVLGDANGDTDTNVMHTYTITNDDMVAGTPVTVPTLSWYTLLLLLLALILTSRGFLRNLIN